MQSYPDQRVFSALFRLLHARLGAPGIGYFDWRPGAYRHCAGTDCLQPEAELICQGSWQALPPSLGRALAAGTTMRIDAGCIGQDAAFCALHPVMAAPEELIGFLVVLDRKPRRLGPDVASALRDCATVLAPLLAAGGRRARGRSERTALSDAILPAASAHRAIESALRAHGETPLALMMLDLDRFRSVNEVLGSAAGDALLAVTRARLEGALGPSDRLVPLEGDRFVIVTSASEADAEAYAAGLLDRVSQPLTLAGQTVVMQASVGIVAVARVDLPLPVLMTRADTALRNAKSQGSNRVVLHRPHLDAAALEKSQLELELSNATSNGEMHLVYQPYIDLDSGKVSGVEALVRWRHPRRGDVLPGSFIPLAEATGLILPLGSWALHTACREAARWPGKLSLSVNVSALQFHQPNFVFEVEAALRDSGFPADRLELEITETVLMRDNPETIAQLETLIAKGIRIALDDFGTGYTALAYLARLPHHRLKLDKSFVQDLANPATADLMRAIIAMARAKGLAVTAEGVERPEQVVAVRAMGFTHAQGYATGLPTADLTQLFGEDVRVAVP